MSGKNLDILHSQDLRCVYYLQSWALAKQLAFSCGTHEIFNPKLLKLNYEVITNCTRTAPL